MIRLSKLFLINIKNYGYFNSLKIILFEIIGFIQFFNYKEFSFIEENKLLILAQKNLTHIILHTFQLLIIFCT